MRIDFDRLQNNDSFLLRRDGPLISFVIPAHNEESELPVTLACLRRSLAGIPSTDWECIVCDNASTDSTAELAQRAGARVVFESFRQIAQARNTGAAAARGHWLLFLDADTRVNRRLIEKLFARVRTGRFGAGGACVRFEMADLPWFPSLVLNTWNLISVVCQFAAGSFLACRRDAFIATGGFSRRYFAGEEIDFSLRLRRWCRSQGLKFFVETSHPVMTSARKLKGRTTWQLMSQLAVLHPAALASREACAFWYDESWRGKRST